MPYEERNIVDHVVELQRRIADLERAVYDSTRPEAAQEDLTVRNVRHKVHYNSADDEGVVSATVVVDWDPVMSSGGVDDIAEDKVYDYMFAVAGPTSNDITNFSSTGGRTTASHTTYSSGSVVFYIYALSKGNVKGPEFKKTVNVILDLGVPQQPDTPVLNAGLGMVVVNTSTLSVTQSPLGPTIKHLEVHYVKEDNVAFELTSDTLYRTVRPGMSAEIMANNHYGPISVRLRAVNHAGTVGPPSTGVVATPKKVVQDDLGVVVSAEIPYSDTDNLIINGSFENEALSTSLLQKNNINGYTRESYDTGPQGGNSIAFNGSQNHSTETFYVMGINSGKDSQFPRIIIDPNTPYVFNYYLKRLSVSNYHVEISINILKRNINADQTIETLTYNKIHTHTDSNTKIYANWKQFSIVIPPTNKANNEVLEAEVTVKMVSVTEGKVFMDAFNIRRVISSQYIQNAAITSAHISDLAVKSAHIESINAGKITSGVLKADQYIKVGDPDKGHSHIGQGGLKVVEYNDYTNEQFVAAYLGTEQSGRLSILDHNKNPIFSVYPTNTHTYAKNLSIANNSEFYYRGYPLAYFLDTKDSLVAHARVRQYSDIVTTAFNVGAKRRRWAAVGFRSKVNQQYEIELANVAGALTQHNPNYLAKLQFNLHMVKFPNPASATVSGDYSVADPIATGSLLLTQAAYGQSVPSVKTVVYGSGGIDILYIDVEITSYSSTHSATPDIRGRLTFADIFIREVSSTEQNMAYIKDYKPQRLIINRDEMFTAIPFTTPMVPLWNGSNSYKYPVGFKSATDPSPMYAAMKISDSRLINGRSKNPAGNQSFTPSFPSVLSTYADNINSKVRQINLAELYLSIGYIRTDYQCAIHISASDDPNRKTPTKDKVEFIIPGPGWHGWINITSILKVTTKSLIISLADPNDKHYFEIVSKDIHSDIFSTLRVKYDYNVN